jgi:site-specific DNA recombinase
MPFKGGRMEKITRIIGYARESTQRQAENGFNLDDQERRIRNYVDIYYSKDGYDLTIIREEGASAKSINRPEFAKVIERIKSHTVDVVVIYTYDRFTRRLKDFIALLELMDKNHVTLDSIMEKFDTSTAMGRFSAHQVVAMAEWEEDTIGERTIRGLEESARQGNFCKNKAPLGYIKVHDGKAKKLQIDPEKADVVRNLFEQIANHDETPFSMANKMSQEHVLGMQWSNSYVYKIMKNKEYYGTFVFRKKEYPDSIPPIVSKELWLKANHMHSDTRRYTRHQYIFKGYVKCNKCKDYMTGTFTSKKHPNRTYIYYRCKICGKVFSEKIILKDVDKDFSKIYRNDLFTIELKKLQQKYTYVNRIIDHLSYDQMIGNLKENYYKELTEQYADKASNIIKELNMAYVKARETTFEGVKYSAKREFLGKYIDKIIVDPISKATTIKWLK